MRVESLLNVEPKEEKISNGFNHPASDSIYKSLDGWKQEDASIKNKLTIGFDQNFEDSLRGNFPKLLPLKNRFQQPDSNIEPSFSFLHFTDIFRFVTYYRLHLLYIITLDLIGTCIIWLSPQASSSRISFVNALYSCTSAITATGLVPTEMENFTILHELVIMFLMILGGQTLVSLLPVYVRRFYFERYLDSMQNSQLYTDSSVHSSVFNRSKSSRSLSQVYVHPIESTVRDHHEEIIDADAYPSVPIMIFPSLSSESSVRSMNKQSSFRSLDREHSMRPRDRDEDASSRKRRIVDFVQIPSESNSVKENGSVSAERGKIREEEKEGEKIALIRNPTDEKNEKNEQITEIGFKYVTSGLNQTETEKEVETGTEDVVHFETHYEEYVYPDDLSNPINLLMLEDRALQLLCKVVLVYVFGFQLLSACLLYLILHFYSEEKEYLASRNVNVPFFCLFQSVSAFNNAGYSLVDDSLMSFQKAIPFLMVIASMILLGNTMFAPSLRGIINLLCFSSSSEMDRRAYHYLLDHPRRCFTHLFPWHQTLWLILTVICFNGVEFIACLALDWTSAAFDGLEIVYKCFDALFQSISTRNAGLAVINISLLSPAMCVLYVGMMYIAAYPVFLSREGTRVQSKSKDVNEEDVLQGQLNAQGRKLLAKDSAYLFLSLLLICILHNSDIRSDTNFQIFNIVFEIISGYGLVGLSLGYVCENKDDATCVSPSYSFSGVWKWSAKLVIVFVMLMGRHRGLPDNVDSAISVPKKYLNKPGVKRRRGFQSSSSLSSMPLLS